MSWKCRVPVCYNVYADKWINKTFEKASQKCGAFFMPEKERGGRKR